MNNFWEIQIEKTVFNVKASFYWVLHGLKKVNEKHCCPRGCSSLIIFVDFTDLNRCKSAFPDFDPSFT